MSFSDGQPVLSRPSRLRESGGGSFGLIVTLLILAAVGYVAYQAVPTYVHNYELNDYLNDLVLQAVSNKIKPEDIPAAVLDRCQELNLPVSSDNVNLTSGGDTVAVHVAYTRPVNLWFYIWQVHYSASASAPRLAY